MAANSSARRLIKRLLYPLLGERSYQALQCMAMAWDIRTGNWHEPELDLLPKAVHTGEIALDVGANYGVYSYHLARVVGRTGRVFAFEPVPFTYGVFRMIARLLRFPNTVKLITKGCGAENGQTTFTVLVQDSGAPSAGQSHLGTRQNDRPGHEKHVKYSDTRQVTCDIVRIDDFLAETKDNREVSFLKMDIEGAELFALRGAIATLERFHPTVLCEINLWFLEGFGIALDELLGLFSSRGYKVYCYDAGVSKLRAIEAKDIQEGNYLFIHETRLARFSTLV